LEVGGAALAGLEVGGKGKIISNCEFKSKEAGVRIQNMKIKMECSVTTGYWLLATDYFI
jgi:hypothetical protein